MELAYLIPFLSSKHSVIVIKTEFIEVLALPQSFGIALFSVDLNVKQPV